jgi:hypothetical protein
MKRTSAFALLCNVLLVSSIFAQDETAPIVPRKRLNPLYVPPVVATGFTQFAKSGTLAAIDTWLAGSARETDDDYQDAVRARLERVRGHYGQALGFEIIRSVSLSISTLRCYVAVKFEKGVGWMSFDCYKPADTWIVTRIDFQTNANVIIPPNILGGQ